MTFQVANRIHVHGAFHALMSAPEMAFWHLLGRRPPFRAQSTSNWSGYVSHWAVRDDMLYLTDIVGVICQNSPGAGAEKSSWCAVGHFGPCSEVPFRLADILEVPFGGVLAVWFSGQLRIPKGKLVEYVHAGWASGYERDLILEIRDGTVVSEKIVRIPAISKPRVSRRRSFWDVIGFGLR